LLRVMASASRKFLVGACVRWDGAVKNSK
jgi:hypothetical protein